MFHKISIDEKFDFHQFRLLTEIWICNEILF